MKRLNRIALPLILLAALSACSTQLDSKDYTLFRATHVKSILIVPTINNTNEVDAANLFLSTLPIPLAEKGYYVFPVNMVKGVLDNDGLSDPSLVHTADPTVLAALFGTDTILYVEILDWSSSYQIVGNSITVEFLYTLKEGRLGKTIWQEHQTYVYSTNQNSGNPLVDIIASAITAIAQKLQVDYSPMAIQANALAFNTVGQGLPAGPKSLVFQKDLEEFPPTGSGKVSNVVNEGGDE